MKTNLKVIGFDADDTLWVNENYYRDTENQYARLLSDFDSVESIKKKLFKTEMQNLSLYGYGIKAFVISMMENAIEISNGQVTTIIMSQIIAMGKEMLEKPIELLPGVVEVLEALSAKYRLVVATKGDLLDQENKLNRSGLAKYFHHIEIMSEKTEESYKNLLNHLDIAPENFVMIGNSLRSDILPPYKLGSYAIHVPYAQTWEYEMDVEEIEESEQFYTIKRLDEVLSILL